MQSLKTEVKQIHERLAPRNPKDILVYVNGHRDGEPHGFLQGQILRVHFDGAWKSEYLATTKEQELEHFTKTEYDHMIKKCPFMLNPEHVWSTYEKWLESHRCKCGQHGQDGTQPYSPNGA